MKWLLAAICVSGWNNNPKKAMRYLHLQTGLGKALIIRDNPALAQKRESQESSDVPFIYTF